MLDHFGVTEETWLDAAKQDPHFAASETPYYIGRAVAALAADPNIAARSGQVLMSGDIAQEFALTDIDGRQPNWRTYYAGVLAGTKK